MSTQDPYDLNRFVAAQEGVYEAALSEIQRGRKRSHWMWYIFPQFVGLGFSATSKKYGVKSRDEAKAYLAHLILGPRLFQCARAVLEIEGRSAYDIFGMPDDLKLRSCATLFARVSSKESVLEQLLEKYFNGEPDADTLRLIGGCTT